MDITAGWPENYAVFVEIGAASSVCTRLIRQTVPKKIEQKEGFRRFLHYVPVFAAALFLGALWLFPSGGFVVLHSVTLGGMSSNFRDVFNIMQKRLSAGVTATEAKASLEEKAGGVLEAITPEKKAAPMEPPLSSTPDTKPAAPLQEQDEKGS